MGHVQNMFDKCVCIYTYIYIYISCWKDSESVFFLGACPWEIHPAILGSFSSNGQAPAKEVFEMTARVWRSMPELRDPMICSVS